MSACMTKPGAHLKGIYSPWAKLTDADVIKIRSFDKSVKIDTIRESYPHVSRIALWKARVGINWKHIQTPPIKTRSKHFVAVDAN